MTGRGGLQSPKLKSCCGQKKMKRILRKRNLPSRGKMLAGKEATKRF
jgi:hypothetical protein